MHQILKLFYKNNSNKNIIDERTSLLITSDKENRVNNKTIVDTLNKDLLIYIFSFLPLESIPATALTCKIFSNIIREESFWRYLGTKLLEAKPELTKTNITNNNSQMVCIKNQATLFDRYSVIKNRSLNTKNEIYKNQGHAYDGVLFVLMSTCLLFISAVFFVSGLLIKDRELVIVGICIAILALLSCCFSLYCVYKDKETNKGKATKLALLNNIDKNICKKLSAIESVFPEKVEDKNISSELDKQECVVDFKL